jgi:2-polyprenyl-3-methyl-5-hydroxy-6-metoxy-1,4-benzoquinol methylase
LVDAGLLSAWLVERRIEAVKPFLVGRVLDFACGHGQLADFCDPQHYKGYDVDPRKIAVAKEHYPKHRFETVLSLEERYDTVAALAFIEHVEPEPYLAQFRSLLDDGGRIVLTTPHPSYEWMHAAASKVHFVSPVAHDEHESLISPSDMSQLADRLSLELTESRRFLLGANQLFVLTQRAA